MLAGEELFTEPVFLDHRFWLCCVYTLLSHDTIYVYGPLSIPGPVQPGHKRKGSQFVSTPLSPGGCANFCPNSLNHTKPLFSLAHAQLCGELLPCLMERIHLVKTFTVKLGYGISAQIPPLIAFDSAPITDSFLSMSAVSSLP